MDDYASNLDDPVKLTGSSLSQALSQVEKSLINTALGDVPKVKRKEKEIFNITQTNH